MTTNGEEAFAYHLSRGSSSAFVTLNLSGFLAGRRGDGPSKNPFPAKSVHAHEWEQARLAGAAPKPEAQGMLF